MNRTREYAPAKINWYLSVGAKRADGYHDIVSLMQTVSLCDELVVAFDAGEGISLTVSGNNACPAGESNLVCRAAALFLQETGRKHSVTLHLEKRIPMAAGLAGGSADAAATLRACNRLAGYPLSEGELATLGAKLGSDIPFCLSGGLALCSGRGERVTPLTAPAPYALLLVNTGEPVSTGAAYAMLDSTPRGGNADWREAYRALIERDFDALGDYLVNDFTRPILPTCPQAYSAYRALAAVGGIALMSGSGSTVFGVFRDTEAAEKAKTEIGGYPFVTVVSTEQKN